MTKFVKKDEINSEWFEIDATGAVVGRLATVVSKIIRGKRKLGNPVAAHGKRKLGNLDDDFDDFDDVDDFDDSIFRYVRAIT